MLIFDKTPITNKEVKNITLRNTTLTKQTVLKKQPSLQKAIALKNLLHLLKKKNSRKIEVTRSHSVIITYHLI